MAITSSDNVKIKDLDDFIANHEIVYASQLNIRAEFIIRGIFYVIKNDDKEYVYTTQIEAIKKYELIGGIL